MRQLTWAVMALGLLIGPGCGSDQPRTGTTPANQPDTTAVAEVEVPKHNCTIPGTMLEGNEYWLPDLARLVVVVADAETLDEDYGEGHRIVEVYDTRTCQRIDRQVLPVDVSPDFPYFIARINYSKANHLIAIRGFNQIYLYDLETAQLLKPLRAQFLSPRYAEDAQSGMIKRLEVWEDFLIGFAQDKGCFAFDLTVRNAIKPVLPFAEFAINETEFASLFLVDSDSGGTQAILPRYVLETDEFEVNPLLSEPVALETNVTRSARNNRHLVLRQKDAAKTPVAIDMAQYRRLDLPAEVANKPTQSILEWMRKQ